MNKQDDLHYFICEGPALDALKAYKDEIDLFLKEYENIQEELNTRAVELKHSSEANLHGLWTTMVMHLGLDPSVTWQNSEYQVETRYIDNGFGAVIYNPHDSEFAEMMGLDPDVKSKKPAIIEVPDKKRLN